MYLYVTLCVVTGHDSLWLGRFWSNASREQSWQQWVWKDWLFYILIIVSSTGPTTQSKHALINVFDDPFHLVPAFRLYLQIRRICASASGHMETEKREMTNRDEKRSRLHDSFLNLWS